jgi:hypothetical protein
VAQDAAIQSTTAYQKAIEALNLIAQVEQEASVNSSAANQKAIEVLNLISSVAQDAAIQSTTAEQKAIEALDLIARFEQEASVNSSAANQKAVEALDAAATLAQDVAFQADAKAQQALDQIASIAQDAAIQSTAAEQKAIQALDALNSIFNLAGLLANSVLYLNASKIVTTSASLTFDGANLGIGTSLPGAKLDVTNGYIISGTTASVNGSKILAGYYSAGQIATFGGEFSSGGPVLGYGVWPSTTSAGAFVSSTTINAPRGAYNIAGNQHIWYGGGAQTVAIDSAVTTTETMRLDASGNLGIGTSSPQAKLSVAGSAQSSSATYKGDIIIQQSSTAVAGAGGLELVADAASSGYGARIQSTFNGVSAYDLSFQLRNNSASWTQRMLLDSSGNLGLGVTPSAWASTSKALQVSTFVSVSQQSSGAANFGFNFYEDAANAFKYSSTDEACRFSALTDGGFGFFTAPSGTAGNTISFTQAMTLDATARLLVGGTSAVYASNNGAIEVQSANGASLNAGRFAASAGGPTLTLFKSRNATVGGNTIVVNGDTLGEVSFVGANGTGYDVAASIRASVDGTPGASADMPGRLTFFTSADGSATPTERARITSTGNQLDFQPAESAQNTSVTLSVANLQTRVITSNAAVTLTLPTGTSLEGYTNSMTTDTAFEVTFIATTANAITIAANGNTTVGNLTVSGNTSGMFRFRRTALNTFTVYRVA